MRYSIRGLGLKFLIISVCVGSVNAQQTVSSTETKKNIAKTSASANSEIVAGASETNNNGSLTIVSPTPSVSPTPKVLDSAERERLLLERIERLEQKLTEIEARNSGNNNVETAAKVPVNDSVKVAPTVTNTQNESQKDTTALMLTEDDRGVLDFFRETTLNFGFDGYYGYNFNRPFNRFNQLRAYDVSSNSFSLNQANVVIENLPDVEKGKRYGFRLDLQYGQATETLQGNPVNELRPQAFRPLWQAYGTYVAPVGKGLTLDFGKFASSLGYETNYTKDNFNYSRSFFFNYLPYYHFGLRASYPVTKKLTATYWLVNGAQQSEDFNSSKSQAILFTYKPTERVVLQGNYYAGREQRDQDLVTEATPLNFDTTRGRLTPKGKFQVYDAYATFNLTDKLTLAVEGDYVTSRFNRNSATARVYGGVGYLRYQFTPKFALTGRGEYLSDKAGLFSGKSQDLKEFTMTSEYKFAEGFLVRGEFRRDYSNQPYFFTNDLNALKKEQNTATIGLVWWFGRKQGAW